MTNRAEICDALCHILGNTCRIHRTTRSYEWNASGPGSELVRLCLHDQANEMRDAIGPIAQQILGLGGQPIFDYSDGVVAVNPPSGGDLPILSDMVDELYKGHTQAKLSIGAAIDVARDADELATMVFLAGRIDMHRAHRHRLGLISAKE
ncbi:ferritin-like domain-containing protein [uncultured Tateyamaria sp.]|uniref:ferritin-like domain-containing protein n=1 Tax=uncultured Tateyamaria sp. TaxID=455651 RepID=UPI00260B48FF|nr:ferritin-like domain-containing protein [uncultured Tateyamaria sp.]